MAKTIITKRITAKIIMQTYNISMKKLFIILSLLVSLNSLGQNYLREKLDSDTGVNFLAGSHPSRLEPTLVKHRDSIYLLHTQTTSDQFHQLNLTVGTSMIAQSFIDRGIIIGQGSGSAPVGRSASSSCMFIKEDTFFVFALDGYGFPGDSRCVFGYYSVGTPYGPWVGFSDTVFVPSDFAGIVGYGNTYVWPERVGGKFHALTEGFTVGGLWQILHAESYQISSGWTITHNVSDLQAPTGGMYGGSSIVYYDGTWHIFYHYGTSGGNLPTWIAYATSTDDFVTATIQTLPLIPYFYGHFDIDVTQLGDPDVKEIDGSTYLVFEIVVNESPTRNQIRVMKAPMQFYKFIKP